MYQQRSMCVIYYAQMRPMYSWGSALQRQIWYTNVKRDLYMSKENYKCHVSTEDYIHDVLFIKETYEFVRVYPTTSELMRTCQKRPIHIKRDQQVWQMLVSVDMYRSPLAFARQIWCANVKRGLCMSKETHDVLLCVCVQTLLHQRERV